MSEDTLLRETYNKVLQIHQELPALKGEVIRLGGAVAHLGGEVTSVGKAFASHEVECRAHRKDVARRFGEYRGKLDSVTDEVEDTRSRDMRKLQRRAELPATIAKWAIRAAAATAISSLVTLVVKGIWFGHL